LYEGPWVAERFAVVEQLWQRDPEAIEPTVRGIIEQAARFTATDMFKSEYRRAELTRSIVDVMSDIDALLVPTSPTIFTIQEVLDNPVSLNTKLGLYTNFANFADLCALALPTGFRADGLPAGVTLLAPAWHDYALADFGTRLERSRSEAESGVELGATRRRMVVNPRTVCAPASQTIRVAVVGAHLRGMPLNHQLTSRGACFVEATWTASEYRLFALPRSTPPKPGLVRVAPHGPGAAIAVELWDVPAGNFGSFTAEVPQPLGIGNVLLSDGRLVKGFICEPLALEGAEEITSFGGWQAYIERV
jgi:allophanate hydrolase